MAFYRIHPKPMSQHLCLVCGYVYDEASGAPEDGIAPATPWAKLPADWRCPECGAGRDDFELVEEK